ncbi:MAG: dockerin type I repeat-containing protein [Clostridia bacterium]|nr:dockerin type I repeat-containing protein [Clostridia bacterium]
MKKSTKLLSVLLAVLMILSSLSIAASAAKANYKTVANLESLSAYNNYGTVTRLSSEERFSIVLDELDRILAKANINMGTVFNALGLSITIDFRDIDKVCSSLDTIYNTFNSGLATIAMAILNFGIIESVNFDSWKTGMTRAGTAQLTIIYEVLELLSKNSSVVNTALTSGLDLGMIGGLITGLDLSEINTMITDLPTLIRGLIYPLFSRPDDTATLRNRYQAATYDINTTLDEFVKGLLTKPMNWTSYRVDAAGNDLGYTLPLPTTNSTSRYFVINGDTITQYDYQFKDDDDKGYTKGEWAEIVTYTKAEEAGNEGVYVFKAPDGYEGDGTLKYYTAGNDGYFVPGIKDAINNGDLSFSLNGSDSVLTLLYKFVPYVFREMAPVVLNGSVKKLIAELFDVKFTKLGNKGEFTAPVSDTFFTEDQGEYLWEWSNYKVIDGVPYYRFQDEFFVGEIPANISSYYYMFDWNYHVDDDFIDEFIPAADGSTSAAGYTRILQGLNDFVAKVIDLAILDEWTVPGGETYTKSAIFTWTAGGNDKMLNNILNVARNVVQIAPVEIFGDYYQEAQFYDVMMTGTLSQAVNGAICEGVKMLMPQIIFPDNVVNQNMLAIAAVVVRELCSQLMPSYNFDALIYADYNDRAVIEGKDQLYWLNTTLTMGLDLGLYYLRNLADLGEDTSSSYYTVMKNLGATPTNDAEAMTYTADFDVSKWTYKVDWVIDWALATDEWCWRMSKLVNATGATTLTSYQDPWAKLNSVLLAILPLDQLLNADGASASTFLEKVLRNKIVDAISNLDLPTLVSLFDIPAGYFRNGNIINQAVKLVVKIVNGVVNKSYGGELLASGTYTTINAVLNHSNLKSTVTTLVGKILSFVYTNGVLDVALPFINMFLGWKTDPQEYKDPDMYWFNDGGDTYLYRGVTNTLRFVNNSSGMLLKHRNAAADKPYNIVVKAINFGTSGITSSQSLPVTCAPYETLDIPLTIPANTNKAFEVAVTYAFTGKDGAALGGDQTVYYYGYISTVQDQEHEHVDDVDTGDYWQRNGYDSYVFTRDIYDSVTHYQGSASYKAATIQIGNKTKNFQSVKYDTTPGAPMSTYFQLITDRATAGWVSALVKDSVTNTSGYFWKAKSGVTADTDFPYGVYDGGQIALKYGSKSGTYIIDFIYYNDFDITSVMNKYIDMQIDANDVTSEGATAYNTYKNALLDVVKWADIAKRTDYVTAVQPNIEPAIAALDAAYEALKPYLTVAPTNYEAVLQSTLDACEDRDSDYDFQDFKLFEYFKYENQRTNIREMIKAYAQPTEPTPYIENENISYEAIQDIIANETNANIKAGINATLVPPTEEAMDAYRTAAAEWVAPNYSELQVADTVAKLPYYKAFMTANPRDNYYNQFLAKEVAYADANFPASDEALYSPDTWAEYATRLATAKSVLANANALHSEIFDAKYFLMVAMRNLNEIEHSMKDDGNNYLDQELTGLIANAEVILNNAQYYDVVAGKTADEAWAELVKALGVRYTDENGNDAILYDHSAYTFVDYDRVNTTKNKLAVDAAADKLQAAIDNFVCNVVIEQKDGDNTVEQIETAIKTIQGITPGSILTVDQLLSHVKASVATATLEATVSKANAFGTGAKVDVNVAGIGTLTTYVVVIFGDVNGDGAIDAFDAFDSNKAINNIAPLADAYATAADVDLDDAISLADYATIKAASVGNAEIAQVVA